MRISDWSSDVCSSDLFSDAVEQGIKRPANPEIFLHILRRRPETLSRRDKQAATGLGISTQNFVKCGVHRGEASLMTIGRNISCIQAGRVVMPSARSVRSSAP